MRAQLIEASDATFVEETIFPPEIVEAGDPRAKSWLTATLDAPAVKVGVWSGAPGVLRVPAYPYDEMFVVTTGHIELVETDGSSVHVRPGQACLLRKGWQGLWRTVEPTTKHYMIASA